MVRRTKQIIIEETTTILSELDLIQALKDSGLVPRDVDDFSIFVEVPSRGDWSGADLDIRESTGIHIVHRISKCNQ